MNGVVRENLIIPMEANETHADKEGYFVNVSSGKAALVTATTDVPFGVILEGAAAGGYSSVALQGCGKTVRVKVDATPGTITPGSKLKITATGTVTAYTSGEGHCPCMALENGAANELIEARLFSTVQELS